MSHLFRWNLYWLSFCVAPAKHQDVAFCNLEQHIFDIIWFQHQNSSFFEFRFTLGHLTWIVGITWLPFHCSAQNSKRVTKSSQDSITMAVLVDHLPIIYQQNGNCIFISARDMGTLIYKIWQPWNKKYGFMGFWWCLWWIQGKFWFSGVPSLV